MPQGLASQARFRGGRRRPGYPLHGDVHGQGIVCRLGALGQLDAGQVWQKQDYLSWGQGVSGPGLGLLCCIHGLANFTTVLRGKGELECFRHTSCFLEMVTRHEPPGKHLQKHPGQLDGKQRGDEEQAGGSFFHDFLELKWDYPNGSQGFKGFPANFLTHAEFLRKFLLSCFNFGEISVIERMNSGKFGSFTISKSWLGKILTQGSPSSLSNQFTKTLRFHEVTTILCPCVAVPGHIPHGRDLL